VSTNIYKKDVTNLFFVTFVSKEVITATYIPDVEFCLSRNDKEEIGSIIEKLNIELWRNEYV